MIVKHCKKLKWQRKIVLITDGHGSLDEDGIFEIIRKIKEDDIELTILCVGLTLGKGQETNNLRGVDFDDPEFGFKEENKDSEKVWTIQAWTKLSF